MHNHAAQRSAEEHVEVTIEEVVFRSDDGRFVVAAGSRPHGRGVITLVGELGAIARGETFRVAGRFQEHARFGVRFRVHSFTPILPSAREGIIRYLGSGLIEGIGKKLAERIVAHFGEDALEIIATQSERLSEVSGIGKQRARAISDAVRARRAEAELLSFLHSVGLGPSLARKVLQQYGQDAPRVLREDPYLVAEQLSGIGFRTADAIGRALGIGVEDPRRAAGAALHIVGSLCDQGHVYADLDQICEEAQRLEVPRAGIVEALAALQERRLLIEEERAYYAPPLFYAETDLAERLAKLARPRPPSIHRARALEAARASVALSEEQMEAVRLSIDAGLLVLTGGPGTGKTTTVRAILAAQRALERRTLLCAPTGRAAKRLSEAAGQEAKTIHRLLEWNPMSGGFQRDESAPLEADLILVDEASMLNLTLAQKLLAAIAPSTRLLLVGDVDQLPPVGAGQVLRELISSEVPALVRLHQVFRQAQESAIVRGAHAVLRGETPQSSSATEVLQKGELFVISAKEPEAIEARLVALMNRIALRYRLDPVEDVMVVTPTRRGPVGTERLNEILQRALNAEARGDGLIAPGDKVMQLRNDYERDVYNGDIGTVAKIEGARFFVHIDDREVRYTPDDLDALSLAYASTVHKVQGSEFPAVIVVLHSSQYIMLNRALLYTALTRAKQLAIVVGDPRALARAVRNDEAYISQSRLARRLIAASRES